jgi:sphingolipid 4-desaturase/C4-monooxygenase
MLAGHTDDSDPHAARRRAILEAHPDIRRLFGYDRRTIAVTVAVVAAQLALAGALAALHRGGSPLGGWPAIAAAAWLAGALLNHFCGVAIHEAAHNLCARTTDGNRWLALLANLPLVVPGAMAFRRHHLGHHRYLGVPGLDHDLPADAERRWVGNSSIRKVIWLLLHPLFAALGRGFLARPDRWERLNLAAQLLADAALVALLGGPALAYLALSTLFAFGLHPVAGHRLLEHHLWRPDQETYSYYGPLNHLTWNAGHHLEHHDFPSIPGSRLPALRRAAPGFYPPLASHRSSVGLMWRFVLSGRMGHHARRVRKSAVLERALARLRAAASL